jgi:hypothetical protein
MNLLEAGVVRRFNPGSSIWPGRPALDAGTSRCEGFSHPANSSGIQGACSSASTTLKLALRSRRASQRRVGIRWRTLLRCFKAFLSYSRRKPRNSSNLTTFSCLTNTVMRRREPLPFLFASLL